MASRRVFDRLCSGSDRSSAPDARTHVATAFARARTAVFDAKSNESLTLIARGNGAGFDRLAQATESQPIREPGWVRVCPQRPGEGR